jgi:DNA ligase (NAD+)
VGESASKKIIKHVDSIDKLAHMDIESLSSIDEIGDKTAKSIVDFFSDINNIQIINQLKSFGLNFYQKDYDIHSAKLNGKIFVISGVFESYSRDEIKNIIELNGGKISSSVSKKTNYLVAGNNIGPSKLSTANELGVSIINEVNLIDLIS